MSPLRDDPYNLMIYESTNYESPNDMKWVKFNISWNSFDLLNEDRFRAGFRLCYRNDFSAKHRAIQYILLCYYVGIEGILRPDEYYEVPMDVGWYNERKHDCMTYNICHYAPSLAAQMLTITNDCQEDGTYRDVTHIERSEENEDVFSGDED